METDPVSKMSCFPLSRIPDNEKSPKNPSNSECYTPSSESLRIHLVTAAIYTLEFRVNHWVIARKYTIRTVIMHVRT
jgi:hypothetical protein